jgi:hypothetical protein
MVAVSDLMSPAKDLQKARLAIPVPIRVPLPDRDTPHFKSIRMFNSFYSRCIFWVIDTAKSLATGEANAERVSSQIATIINQLREWEAFLRDKSAMVTDTIEVAQLRVLEIDAKFGTVFLRTFVHQCGWETYSKDCIDMLLNARQIVQALTHTDAKDRGPIVHGMLSVKLMPILNRIIEYCSEQEARRLGLDILTMITGYSDYTLSQFSSLMIAQSTPGGIAGKAAVEDDFEPSMRYTVVGYIWDAQRNMFMVKLAGFSEKTGKSVERAFSAPQGQLSNITPT